MSNPLNHYGSHYPHPTSTPTQQRPEYSHHYGSQMAGLDALAESSQYALEQLHNPSAPGHHYLAMNRSPIQHRSQSFPVDDEVLHRQRAGSALDQRVIKKSSQTPVRRRISRACDQCNQLRTKCDGKQPCAHCVEFNLSCEYARERKKRGKASKKDIAAAQAAAAAASRSDDGQGSPSRRSSTGGSPTPGTGDLPQLEKAVSAPADQREKRPSVPRSVSVNDIQTEDVQIQSQHAQIHRAGSFGAIPEVPAYEDGLEQAQGEDATQQYDSPFTGMSINSYGPMHGIDRTAIQAGSLGGMQMITQATPGPSTGNIIDARNYNFNDPGFAVLNAQNHPNSMNGYRYSNPSGSPVQTFPGFPPQNPSPGWASLPSPGSNTSNHTFSSRLPGSLKYPTLAPLVPYLGSIIPTPLACELLEVYFASSSSAQLRPQSPYILGYVFRKKSMLSQSRPRKCTPALLASMLWIAAQTHEAPFLTSPPTARGRVCQKLLELTISLLKPLVHGPAAGETHPNYPSTMVINGVALGGFGVSIDQVSAETSITGALDDVATYVHLATVVSASEHKSASLRWWNAAWSLARELKLGRELPPSRGHRALGGDTRDTDSQQHATPQNMDQQSQGGDNAQAPHEVVTEEEREERRRLWWLLYTMDRHLALCYNRPLFFLDKECDGLLQPMSDSVFQSGDFNKPDSPALRYRRRGPGFECTGHSIFGYFLPLMTILGEIVDINHARNHPRFGLAFRNSLDWEPHAKEIANQLQAYGQSLQEFEESSSSQEAILVGGGGGGGGGEPESAASTGADQASPSVNSSGSRMTESIYQTKIVVAYGTHIMHVFHILLTGKWDPISLLDDNDLWISSESFIKATSHAVKAAEALSDILEYDPDLSFMPFFFGVYLLQGSFLLLLIADKLQGDASSSVIKACETIVRAHEACVVTLNTEYQRNFRKVMRSALMQVKGRVPEDYGEQQQRRREVLSLYRWTGDGTGLAL